MLERISEPISNLFLKKLVSTTEVELINFQSQSNFHKSKIPGSSYNFNYKIIEMNLNYICTSVQPKPYQEYKLTDTEANKRAADVEFSRIYNELNGYAIKFSLFLTQAGIKNTLGEKLLYGYPISLDLPLLQYLGTTIMSTDNILSAQVSRFSSGDKLIVSCAYTGNVNYTFDSGSQSHIFP